MMLDNDCYQKDWPLPTYRKSIALQHRFALTSDRYRLLHEETWESAEYAAFAGWPIHSPALDYKARIPLVFSKKVSKTSNFGRWILKDLQSNIQGFICVDTTAGRYNKAFIYVRFNNSAGQLSYKDLRHALYSTLTILGMIADTSVHYVFYPGLEAEKLKLPEHSIQECLSREKSPQGLTKLVRESYMRIDQVDLESSELGSALEKELSYFAKRRARLQGISTE